MSRKILLPLLIICLTVCCLFHVPVFAEDCANIKALYGEDSYQYKTCSDSNANTTGEIFKGTCRSGFLGLVSWDCGVKVTNKEDSLKDGILTIVSNVATDITIIAAYLVLGYVIYGGYLYIFSYGDPGKVATGKKTLTQAFIGLAIVMSAYLIMSTIRFALLGASGKFNCDFMGSGENCVDANSVITSAIQWAIGIGGAVAAIFVVYGGVSYVTSAGDPNKLQKAKQAIIYALIGLAIVALAEAITAFISSMIRDADNAATSSFYQQTITPKELHEKQIN